MLSEVLIVALTIFGEARGEEFSGKVMVGEVIVNRSRLSGRTLREVCLAPRQFSCWNGMAGKKLEAELCNAKTIGNPAWEDCIRIAKVLCGGYEPTSKATHYFNPQLVWPAWEKSMVLVAVVGNHRFYAENTKW